MANIQKENILTQEYVKELFDYKDGFLYWKTLNPGNINGKAKIGEKAGYISVTHSGPRRIVRILKYSYYTSRIIFFYHHGYFPEFVDHKDRNKANENIDNLRPADKFQNAQNVSKQNNKSSKYLGVTYIKGITKRILKTTGELKIYSNPCWCAQLTSKGKKYNLGKFKTEIEAAIAFNEGALKYNGEFANLNTIDSHPQS